MANNTIEMDYCPDCEGMGHDKKTCKCKGSVAFIVVCCKTCGGEGFIYYPPSPEEPNKIWTPSDEI